MSEYCVNCEQMSRDLAKARDDVALLADRIKELEAALEEIATHNRDMHGYCGTISAVMERLHPKEAHR